MHTPTLRSLAVCTTLGLFATACGSEEEFTPPPPFEETDDVRAWANSSSAVGVYSNFYEAIAVADGAQTYADPECPVIEDDGTTWTATGGCSDSTGKEWKGSAEIVRDGDDKTLTLDGYQGDDGTVTLHAVDAELHEFDAQAVLGGVTTLDYQGSVQGGYAGPTLWNGSGSVERKGFLPPNGKVEATTLDEIFDNDVCAGQALSGKTTITSGEDVAVITYDGESDCDADENAMLTVNDEDRGLIDGIGCSVGAAGNAGSPGVFGASLALALALFRLRRRSS